MYLKSHRNIGGKCGLGLSQDICSGVVAYCSPTANSGVGNLLQLGARLYFSFINQRLSVFRFFEGADRCQQVDVIQVLRSCFAARTYSQGPEMPLLPAHLPVGVAQPQDHIWEVKKNLYPHLGFLQA